MKEKLIVFVTCENLGQAETIARAVVGEKLAACVNVLPGVRSCYVWEGKLTWSEEVMLLVKTTQGQYEGLQAMVRALHNYEVPEIVAVKIEIGFEKYLQWIEDSV